MKAHEKSGKNYTARRHAIEISKIYQNMLEVKN